MTTPPPVGAGPSTPGQPVATVALLLDPHLERRVQRVLRHLSSRGWRIATAESCTGGLLASLFTDVPGVSHVFDRGFVTYDSTSKAQALGVDAELLATAGPVCQGVAEAMAGGALDRSDADVAVATTGWADTGREPGRVHLAVAVRGGPTLHRERHFGSVGRGWVRVACLDAAVRLLEEAL